MTNKELLKGNSEMLVLKLLERKTMYGYEMIKEITSNTGGEIAFKPGTLYPVLHGLEEAGHIKGEWIDTKTKKPRKYYSINESGLLLLREKEQEWTRFYSSVNNILNPVNIVFHLYL